MSEPTSPATATDRAVRALADAVGESRPRVPGDGADPDIPVAATVVVLRDGDRGPEVLMIERPDRGSFAGAWVFPGGKVEPQDRLSDSEPEEAVARRAGVRETREESGLVLAAEDLWTVSCWDPPPGLPLRIRTWFFAARATTGDVVLSPDEAVGAEWIDPAVVLERHARGEVTLYPPTWVTLHTLAGQRDVRALLGMLRLAGFRRFETVARRGETGPLLLWQEDAEYEGDAAAGSSARHRLDLGALPWTYTRTD
ncbi:NUDIX domain-containing protein [Microbacterium sp. BK668]|uniref:NUDIX hydrolase n=1 Tax=Microbacterium sp. BK668 TaxID=2512118 RepID=UPI001060E23A|nr:NUDIX domain-containing protein [Microbacterium sp. BK668]TDN88466.1 8-oxo-dGTP pyrophosphatase MutT (NUDIX family) [Microbacterium sp. BK668]